MMHSASKKAKRFTQQLWLLTVVLCLFCPTVRAACGNDTTAQEADIPVGRIPSRIAEGKADVMITEITEAPYYVKADRRLAAPLLSTPFTHGEIGVLMARGQEDLLLVVNQAIREMKADGTLRRLHEKYGLIYHY